MNNLYISTFESAYQTTGKRTAVDYNNLIKGLLHPVKNTGKKKLLSLWSPTTFKDDHRIGEKAEKIYCLVYDIDDGETSFEVWKQFQDYKLIIHTSWSHTIEHPKYRLIFPLRKPIPAEDWARASSAALQFWSTNAGGSKPDTKALKDKSRAYYRFSIPRGKESIMKTYHTSENEISLRLDYDHIPIKKKPIYKPPTRPLSIKESLLETRIRQQIADGLSGQIVGNIARRIICPQCQKRTVWFKIDIGYNPNLERGESQNLDMTTARCNHLDNCGWRGRINELL